ncbi:MAG TPA: PKD domain-containing protein [Solirubrobacterales bacterium]|nr:PKD domain-containing protein [Solirubrobacterales bacterium]
MTRVQQRLHRLVLALLALAAFGFAPGATGSALAADCNIDLHDGGNYLFDLDTEESETPFRSQTYGGFDEGGLGAEEQDAWDSWGNVFVASPGADLEELTVDEMYVGPNECQLALGDREVRFPILPLEGLQVQRSIFVDPGPLDGARLLTTLRNPGGAPVSVTLVQGDPIGNSGNLGSDGSTFAAATSDGTGVATPASAWGVTTDNETLPGLVAGDPTLAHVWDGPGGAQRISRVGMENAQDELFWAWDVTVPPGATAAFISYEIQQETPPDRFVLDEVGAAVRQAQARQTQSLASLFQGMSPAEIAGTMNWPRPPAPTAAIKPVAKATSAAPVVLDGSASAAAAIPGLPQCAGISTYAWRTDDGATGSAPTLSHAFAPGMHRATLTVTGCGGTATAETSFDVAKAADAKLLILGKVRLNRSKGTATIRAQALVAGTLTLAGKGVKKVTRKLAKPGTVVLPVKAVGKVRKALLKRGEAKVKVVVTLTSPGAPKAAATKKLPLKLGD